MLNIPDELLETFSAEAEENIAAMEDALLALERNPKDDGSIQVLFRLSHSLKGGAAIVGMMGLSDYMHALEDLLEKLRDHEVKITSALITVLLGAIDNAKQILHTALEKKRDELSDADQTVIDQLQAYAQGAVVDEGEADGGNGAGVEVEAVGAHKNVRGSGTLRVDISRLDRLLNLTGEILIARGRMGQLIDEQARGIGGELESVFHNSDFLHSELQELVMQLRMVPIGPLFRRYTRTVRDVAADNKKEADLVIEGADVEVDATVSEHLREPLTHMIRNALDHGIEAPKVRKKAGKPAAGKIILRAFHDAGNIVIQVEDDGKGLDRAKILEQAVNQGIVKEGETLNEQETYRLLLRPGFTTAETVTDLSGRGVGMDVVHRNIESLRGSLHISSEQGKGSIFTIRLPLTLAVIDGFAVGVADETYIIPLSSVTECIQLPMDHDSERERDGSGILELRGEALPFMRLRRLFDVEGTPPDRQSVVVLQHPSGRAGLVVDSLFGETQTVIKPLGKPIHDVEAISGSAIQGDGTIALILDVGELVEELLQWHNVDQRVGRA